ncbi:hypothetical protein LTS14_006037 [Recurvomyces mirabilis]|nr:hypothetical protein LTS14_006037 [Recurvomyces mirabilis]
MTESGYPPLMSKAWDDPRRETMACLLNDGDLEIMTGMSMIFEDLQLRSAIIKTSTVPLDLNAFIYENSPLYINNRTLADFMLEACTNFLHILRRMRSRIRMNRNAAIESSDQGDGLARRRQDDSTSHLSSALFVGLTNIFRRLLSIHELILDRLTDRIERIESDPVMTIPGLLSVTGETRSACAQGALFCSLSITLLEQMEEVLGVAEEPENEELGILSAEQVQTLWAVVDHSTGVAPGFGIMRPADIKMLLRQSVTVLHRLSTHQANLV